MTTKLSVPQPRLLETIVAIGLDVFLPGANQVAGKLIPNSFQRQQRAFLERLAADVHQSGFDIQELQERVAYLAFVQRTAKHGTETADELKHDALLRTARKALSDVTPAEWQVRDLYLSKLAALTPLHLYLLQFLACPVTFGVSDEHFESAMRSANRLKTIIEVIPNLKGQEVLAEALMDDLVGAQLLEPVPAMSMPGSGLHLTRFGRGFTDFVFTDP